MSTVFSILGAIGGMVVVALTIISAINYRKPRKIKLLTNIFYGLFALVSLFVLIFIGGIKLRSIFIIPLITAGMLLGFLRGQSVSFNWQGNQVIGKNSIFFMLFWGLSLTLSLFLGMFDSPLLASLGLIPAVFSSGLQLGYYLNVNSRRLIFSRQEKRNKLLQILIGVFGTLLLVIIFGISTVFAIDETNKDFSKIVFNGSQPEQVEIEPELLEEDQSVVASQEMIEEQMEATVEEQNLPQSEPSGQIKVELLDGNAFEFVQPPAQVAYANDQINTAATDIQLAPFCQSDCFRFNEWLGLMKPGDSYDVIFFQETTAVGVQFWGDAGDGIANVYVDGQLAWSGSTEGTDNKYPGGAFVKYLQINNLKSIQNRILRIETDASGGSVVMYFFGAGEVVR